MKKEFYSNGKLLITGEYLVLDGANALALPTKFGQKLIVEPGENKKIKWTSYDSDGSLWLDLDISFSEIINQNNGNTTESIRNTLIEILHQSYILNPDFIDNFEGYTICTLLTFPRNWGLGTSSTLINNIAQWLQIDAFVLLNNSFGGSGYDIACAQKNHAILYHLKNGSPVIQKVEFKPEFTDNLHFVYLEKKQSSKASILSYYNNKNNSLQENIIANNNITRAVLGATTVEEFASALEVHEAEMSSILEMETIKEVVFPDFNGIIKSLGAWGGDFVLAVSEKNPTDYFKEKGYPTVIPYCEMILHF
jgi:mevalonate kinase